MMILRSLRALHRSKQSGKQDGNDSDRNPPKKPAKKERMRRASGGVKGRRKVKLAFEPGWRDQPLDYSELSERARNRRKKFYRVSDAILHGEELRWHRHWMQRVAGSQVDRVSFLQWVYAAVLTIPMMLLLWALLAATDGGATHGGLLFLFALVLGVGIGGVPAYTVYGWLGGFWYTHIDTYGLRYGEDGQIESVFRLWIPRLGLLEKYEAIRGNNGRAGILDKESYAKLLVPSDMTAHNLTDLTPFFDFAPDLSEMSGNAEASRYATVLYCLTSAQMSKVFKYSEKTKEPNFIDIYGAYIFAGLILILGAIVLVTA